MKVPGFFSFFQTKGDDMMLLVPKGWSLSVSYMTWDTWFTCNVCHLSFWLVKGPCLWSLILLETSHYYNAYNEQNDGFSTVKNFYISA